MPKDMQKGRADCGVGVKSLSIKHVQILDFILANPTMKLREVAKEFDVTQSWLSCIVHSNAFRALLADRQDDMFSDVVLGVREKATALTSRLIDRIHDELDEGAEMPMPTLVDTTDKMLKNLGFGPKTVVNNNTNIGDHTNNNTLVVSGASIRQARERMLNKPPIVGEVQENKDENKPDQIGESVAGDNASLYKTEIPVQAADDSEPESGD